MVFVLEPFAILIVPACDPGVGRDPTLRAAHHLDDDDPVVGFCRGGETVDGLGGDTDRGIEPEGDVGPADVVVDRLWDADHREAFVGEFQRRPERPIPTDDDEAVDAVRLDGALT